MQCHINCNLTWTIGLILNVDRPFFNWIRPVNSPAGRLRRPRICKNFRNVGDYLSSIPLQVDPRATGYQRQMFGSLLHMGICYRMILVNDEWYNFWRSKVRGIFSFKRHIQTCVRPSTTDSKPPRQVIFSRYLRGRTILYDSPLHIQRSHLHQA